MLIELVRRIAAEAPERPAMISAVGTVSYRELEHRAESLARGLVAHGIERFGIAAQDASDVIALLVASSLVGSEACVYPRCSNEDDLLDLASEFDHAVVVTDAGSPRAIPAGLSVELLSGAAGELPTGVATAPLLVLTTGTTGRPKGARHDWSRLLAAVRRPDERGGTRWLLAYNINQFGGIQVVTHALSSGSTLVVPRSRQPQDVITALAEHHVTHVSGTPTFWRLMVGALERTGVAGRLALEQITLGGEAVPEGLIERLAALFDDARISQVYGATEFGTAVAVSDRRSGLPLSILDRDEDSPVRLRIVDGEIQMRSKIGMLGYHGDDADHGEWRSTGDLVEVRGDRILFVGRTSEIINVGGTKVHPLPIEDLVCSVKGVELAAAYGRPNPVTGQIVALDVVPGTAFDTERLEAEIRHACAVLPRPGRPRSIRFVEQIETRGDKLARPGARVES